MADLKNKELLQIKDALCRKIKDSLIKQIDSKSAKMLKIKVTEQKEKSDRNSKSNEKNAKIIQKLKMMLLAQEKEMNVQKSKINFLKKKAKSQKVFEKKLKEKEEYAKEIYNEGIINLNKLQTVQSKYDYQRKINADLNAINNKHIENIANDKRTVKTIKQENEQIKLTASNLETVIIQYRNIKISLEKKLRERDNSIHQYVSLIEEKSNRIAFLDREINQQINSIASKDKELQKRIKKYEKIAKERENTIKKLKTDKRMLFRKVKTLEKTIEEIPSPGKTLMEIQNELCKFQPELKSQNNIKNDKKSQFEELLSKNFYNLNDLERRTKLIKKHKNDICNLNDKAELLLSNYKQFQGIFPEFMNISIEMKSLIDNNNDNSKDLKVKNFRKKLKEIKAKNKKLSFELKSIENDFVEKDKKHFEEIEDKSDIRLKMELKKAHFQIEKKKEEITLKDKEMKEMEEIFKAQITKMMQTVNKFNKNN